MKGNQEKDCLTLPAQLPGAAQGHEAFALF